MTIKEISELTGKSQSTIKEVIRKYYPFLMIKGKRTILNKEQAEKIVGEIKVEIKKNIQPDSFSQLPDNFSQVEFFKIMLKQQQEFQLQIQKQQEQFMTLIVEKLNEKRETNYLPVPTKEPLLELNQIIRNYCYKNNYDYRHVWNQFYTEFKYLYSLDIKIRAKHANRKAIDIIRELGKEYDALALARKLFL